MRQKKTRASVALRAPQGLPKDLVAIADEANRLHESALWSAQGQFEQTKLWRALNLVFGLPAAVLAAIAGGTGLAADHATPVPGILALIAAGFGAALTTLNPSRRVAQSQASANAFLEIQTDARQFVLIRLSGLSLADAIDELNALTDRRNEVAKTADPPSRYAYWRSKRVVIRSGGQSYEVDNEGRA